MQILGYHVREVVVVQLNKAAVGGKFFMKLFFVKSGARERQNFSFLKASLCIYYLKFIFLKTIRKFFLT